MNAWFSGTAVEQIWRDVRLGCRRLLETPLFTIFAVTSLALGLGATTATYSVIDTLLWQPIGVPNPDHLAVLTARPDTSVRWQAAFSVPDFVDLRTQVSSLSSLAASSNLSAPLNLGGSTEQWMGEAVTGNYFDVVGVHARLGRLIETTDDRLQASPVLVLAYDFWKAKAGADPAVVGRTVRLGGSPIVIVGVAPEGFRGLQRRFTPGADGWVSLAGRRQVLNAAGRGSGEDRDRFELTVVSRLLGDASVERAAANVEHVGQGLDASFPLSRRFATDGPLVPTRRNWSVETISGLAAKQAPALASFGAGVVALVGLVLVVACTNLANLMLGRSASRRHECAVRRALGASRARLIREQCAESLMIAAIGGLGGLLMARLLLHVFTMDLPIAGGRVMALEPRLSLASAVVASIALVLAMAIFGLGPALHLTAASVRERLAGEAGLTGSVRWRTRRSIIAWQVTISTTLIIVAAASLRVVTAATLHDPGFDLAHLALGRINMNALGWDEVRGRRAIAALEEASRSHVGFRSVALSSGTPLGWMFRQFCRVSAADRTFTGVQDGTQAALMVATPGIFATLGVPLIRGRAFDSTDLPGAEPVVIISEHVARAVFDSVDVLGLRLRYRGVVGTRDTKTIKTLAIVGVARDTDTQSLFDRRMGAVYVPLAQQYESSLVLIGRTAGDPSTMVKELAAIVHRADPELPISSASTGPLLLTGNYRLLEIVAGLSTGLAALAVGLAMVGLYGVLSHLVARRTREIGLRLALGADVGRVQRMILLDGLRPVWAGLVLGLALGTVARLVLRAVGVGPDLALVDPFAFTVAVTTMLGSAAIACGLPARRAARVEPNVVLHEL